MINPALVGVVAMIEVRSILRITLRVNWSPLKKTPATSNRRGRGQENKEKRKPNFFSSNFQKRAAVTGFGSATLPKAVNFRGLFNHE